MTSNEDLYELSSEQLLSLLAPGLKLASTVSMTMRPASGRTTLIVLKGILKRIIFITGSPRGCEKFVDISLLIR